MCWEFFHVRIGHVSVELPPYVRQCTTWLKFLNVIILYKEETGWLYSSVSQLSQTEFCSQNFQYVLSFHLTKIPKQANTVQRGSWVAAQFSIRTVTETGFCSQSFQYVLSFHLTEIPQRDNLYKEETGWLYSSVVELSTRIYSHCVQYVLSLQVAPVLIILLLMKTSLIFFCSLATEIYQ